MKKSGTILWSLVLTAGIAVSGCQKVEEPVRRHPLATPAGRSPDVTGVAGKSAPPPSLAEAALEVVGPKDLLRAKPMADKRGSSRPGQAPVQKAVPAVPPAKKASGPEENAVKIRENVPPVKEKKQEPFEPLKPPHPMPGA
ncbi:MAG: hypothetical protein HY892_18220 [Deltaproteobacteria bacterium]|nr:hypothetical protein [Deltaproteobacteria bacterium]